MSVTLLNILSDYYLEIIIFRFRTNLYTSSGRSVFVSVIFVINKDKDYYLGIIIFWYTSWDIFVSDIFVK